MRRSGTGEKQTKSQERKAELSYEKCGRAEAYFCWISSADHSSSKLDMQLLYGCQIPGSRLLYVFRERHCNSSLSIPNEKGFEKLDPGEFAFGLARLSVMEVMQGREAVAGKAERDAAVAD